MSQNIYDNPAFFEGYGRLGRSVHGLAGAPEWPALGDMVGDVRDQAIVDLGCGYGWFSRWAREHGAAGVLALDVSERMLARARELTPEGGIDYRRADLEQPALPARAFDLAYSSLTFHYIQRLPELLAAIHAALKPEGRLVFSIEHPIYMASRHPGWLPGVDGRKTWPVDNYQLEGPRVTNWLAEGVVKQHRTLGTLFRLLVEAGFTVTRLVEWGPTEEQVRAMPELAEERERPMMLLVSASA
ncbi:class I SAM-dependent methyltransferase [Pigmentiphaga daeguensis]|uniref:Class I SAM-dependent methyltransferase n=1 Tax=Pigmentiphaga daeguensis TaxID=414049 RepID=A0ABP3M3J4_9BURK